MPLLIIVLLTVYTAVLTTGLTAIGSRKLGVTELFIDVVFITDEVVKVEPAGVGSI